MDRNREGRRTTSMAAPPNGLSSSRRRHRSSGGLRDSPDEEGAVDVQEAGRLRDRGVVKKDKGDRDRDRERDRERERSSRSKRRRESRMMIQSNRDDGDDTSEESVNDEEDDDDDAGIDGGMRMLPPPPANPATTASAVTSNHHSHNNHNPYSQQIHHRKSLPSVGNKVFRGSPAAPVPAWKVTDEMIGVTVPRKARSASTKRSHEWISGGGMVGGGTEQNHRQSSASPVRLTSPAAAPPSPSSSNVSVRKKMKANGGGSKPRPPKSSSKSSSSNPEELEIEIAEVLYGLMTQSQAPSKKEIPSTDSNKSSNENKSLSAVAPKRKRPRQVSENPFSPVSSSIKNETDHHQHHHQSPKTDISSPSADNGVSSFGLHQAEPRAAPLPQPPVEEEGKCVGVVLTKEEVEKVSLAAGLNDRNSNTEAVITTAASAITTNLKPANPEKQIQEEKMEIDLMAPPPQLKTSQESDGDIDLSNHKHMPSLEAMKAKEDLKLQTGKEEPVILNEEQKKSKAVSIQETGESSKQALREESNLNLHIDFEKPNKDSSNRSLHQALKHQQLSTKSETHTEKTAQPSSFPVPMSMANWPPMGYVAPLQGVISMDGNTMPSAPIQPLFTHPRPKRCATHCYIARNIHYLQQLVKMNPFWSPASGPAAPMFAPKHNGMPSTELHASIPQSMQDKGQPVGVFPGHTTGKDTKSSHTTAISDPALRKQQVLLQQAMPSVTPNNILHGPAFIFPFNQQQAVVASASARPGSSKVSSSTATGGSGAASGAANSATVSSSTTAAAAPALSFNYPNMSANEAQYLAIVQNHPYAFPIPAVGAQPNYRGNHPHPQAMPLFNGSFYSSQMIHPSQIPQPPQQAPPPAHSPQPHQNSSGSTSSSQKLLQAQQRQQGSGSATANDGNIYPAAPKSRSQHMNPPAQARVLENEVTGGEDSPSTADSRGSRTATNAMNVHGHNFAMPVHSQNFALMNPQQAASANLNDKKQQQQSQQQVLKRVGVDSSSSLPPQTFAMSFAPMNGATGQNHAIFQSLQHHHMMTSPAVAASVRHSEHKDFRVSEEATKTTGHDSSNAVEDRKGSSAGLIAKSGQSIAFSRPDLATDPSGSSPAAANNRSTRSSISTSVAGAAQSSHHLHGQFQQQQQNQHQQQFLQLQKQQQQHVNARSKNPEHLITSSSAMASMFPNNLSSYPLQTSTTSGSPVQSPQWRSSVRGPTSSQVSSSLPSTTTSSLKNLHPTHQSHQAQQQQSSRAHPQSHTQISFGSQKLQSTALAQMMMLPPQQQQQQQNSSSTNQSPSPPMLVGSPTNSSLSSSQPSKNALAGTQRSSPSILGNPHNSTSSTKSQQQHQQQLNKQTLQQQQQNQYTNMMFRHPYMQVQQAQAQAQQHSVGSMAAAGYYLPRKQQQSTSSTAMLSLSPPVTLASTTTSDPAKAIAAATSNLKGGQGILHTASYGGGAAAAQASIPAGFPQYVHNNPAVSAPAVQVKPAEQKQPAGE